VDVSDALISVPTDVGATGSQLLTLANTIGAEISALIAQLAPLQEYWIGTASSGYQNVQAQWNKTSMAVMSDSGTLGNIASAVIANSGNYDDCEGANTKTWQSQ